MKTFSLGCFFFLSVSCLFAREGKLDSLRALIRSDKEDTVLVSHLNLASREFDRQNQYDSALSYGFRSLALAEKIGWKKGQAQAHNNLGVAYDDNGDYDKALGHYLKVLTLYENLNDHRGSALIYNNIGLVYKSQGNYTLALEYYNRSLSGLLELQAAGHNNRMISPGLANVYNNIGNLYYDMDRYDKALDNHLHSLAIEKESGEKQGIAASLNNIAMICYELGDLEKSLQYHRQSLSLKEEIQDRQGIAYSYLGMGMVWSRQARFREAEAAFRKAADIFFQIKYKDGRQEVSEELAVLYYRNGDFRNAYEHIKSASQLKDSLLNEETSRQIAEMQAKYETEKKEQQIALLSKDKELQQAQLSRQRVVIWSVAGGLAVVMVLLGLIYKERRKSEKLLLNILPGETARELKAKGTATARHYASVTVMFTDFKGFTSLAERLQAEELVSELDFIFRKFDTVLAKYRIEKIKTIGDAYMCVSGLPAPHPDHAGEIVKAALEIQQWMRGLGSRWELRVGIHTGPVTAGVVGKKKFAYDIWGDTVNTASRMESSGEAGKINISGATYAALQSFTGAPGLHFTRRGRIPAKNKGEIEMYFVDKIS